MALKAENEKLAKEKAAIKTRYELLKKLMVEASDLLKKFFELKDTDKAIENVGKEIERVRKETRELRAENDERLARLAGVD